MVAVQQESESMSFNERALIEKIRGLPPGKIIAVETFVEFLHYVNEDRRLSNAATKVSEEAFAKVWGNPEDSDYDQL